MPLDDTTQPRKKARPARALKPIAPAPKLDVNLVARAQLDATLAALLPCAKTTKDRLALQYWAASRAATQTETWRDAAKKAAVGGNVIPDYAADPLPVGTVATVYASALVTIGVKVTPQASRLNVDAFIADLKAAGVKVRTLQRLRKKHTTDFAGAHIITALLASP